MKKNSMKVIALGLIGLMTFGAFLNVNLQRKYKPGDYVASEDAYFVQDITDEADLVKAHKFITPTDNKYSSQKTRSLGSGLIGDIESVWTSFTGKGTTVAIIDDGFDYNHPEYTRSDGTHAILSSSRYYYASGNSAYYKSYSSNPSCIAEDWEDSEWATHGTNTSTTAAAPMNNSGGVGIAPEADILALKIDFSFVAIKAAIQYAIEQNVDVINMSLGAYAESFTDGWGESQSGSSSTATYLNSVCQSAYDAGIIVVAAAGNESTWHKSYPACNSKVIGVGALGDWDNKGNANKLAEFTNYVSSTQTGEINVDILAPGYVYTATQAGTKNSITHTYDDTQGTSFSSPIIAGAACLWKQKYPSGTPSEFLTQLQSSADGIGSYTSKMVPVSGWDSSLSDVGPSNITNGRLNVAKLMNADDPYVSLEDSSFTISKDKTKQINVSSYNGTLSYSSSNTSVATVSNSGLITAVAAGSATITVTATKGGKNATATVSVTVVNPINCTSITLNPSSTSIEAGTTYSIVPTMTYTPSNATAEFLYESSDPTIASVDEDTGVVTGVSAGTTSILVLAVHGDAEAHLSVTVTPSTKKVWKRVNSTSDLTAGDEIIFGAYSAKNVSGQLGSGTYLPALSATFDSETVISDIPNDAETFTVGKSSSSFTFTQKSNSELLGFNTKNLTSGSGTTTWTVSISSGLCEITGGSYKLAYNSGSPRWKTYDSTFASGDYSIYRKSSADSGSTVAVTGVSLNQSALSLTVGNTSTLVATVSPGDATNKTVSWSSSNSSVASVDGGVVTAVSAGSATITVTTQDGGKTATCSVTVSNATIAVTSVSVSPTTLNLEVGDTSTLTATVSPSNATNKAVSWSTDSPSAVSVNSSGKVTALAATSTNAIITVTTSDGGKTATCSVKVTDSGGSGGGGGSSSDTYSLITSTSDLEAGKKYIITNGYDGDVQAMSTVEQLKYRQYTSVTASNSKITVTSTVLLLNLSGSTGSWIFTTDNYQGTDGRLYPASGKNNELYVGSSSSTATISFSGNAARITLSGNSDNRGLISWNSNSGQERFSCYKPGQNDVYLWKQDDGGSGGGGETVTLSSIEVSTAPTKTSYTVDEYFDPTGLVITRNYSNGTDDTYTYANHTSEFSFNPTTSTPLTTAHTSVTITYDGKSTTQAITVTSSGGGGVTPSGDAYQITFKTGSGDGTNLSTGTTKSNYLSAGSEYISSITSTSSTYYAGSNGLKLGASSSSGNTVFALAGTYNVTTIVVNAKQYNSSKAVSLSVNGSTSQSLSSSFDDYEFSINDEINSLTLSSTKYCWVSGVTINLADDEGKVISSLVATYSGGDVYINDTLDTSKVSVTAKYTDSSTYPDAVLKSSDYELSGFSSTSTGSKIVTVTYTGLTETLTTPLTTTFSVTVINDNLSSISVVSSKEEYHPGETISKSDLTLTATYESGRTAVISDFTFTSYQFTYSDAPSGGSYSNKQFSVSYGGKTTSLTVLVSRVSYVTPDTFSSELTGSQAVTAGITGTGASSAANYTNLDINGVICSAENIYVYTVSNVKYMSFGTGEGCIYNTQPLSSSINGISLTNRSGARTDEKLYVSTNGSDWELVSNVSLANNNYRYFKVAFEGTSSSYSNFSKINLELRDFETPTNVANYIMFEDTNNQCVAKFDIAVNRLKAMTEADQTTFMTSSDYVIATARERLEAWARNQGKTISLVDNNITVSSSNSLVPTVFSGSDNETAIFLIIISSISLVTIGGFIYIKKRKEH